jgi:hypothetical protein
MKKKDLFTFVNILNASYPFWEHNKFRQAMLENIAYAQPELEKLEKMQKEDREILTKHDEEHNPLILKYGNEIPNKKGFFIPPTESDDKYAAYMKDYEPIKEKYAKELDEFEKKAKKFNEEILEEELKQPLKTYPISIEYVPTKLPDEYFAYLVKQHIIKD